MRDAFSVHFVLSCLKPQIKSLQTSLETNVRLISAFNWSKNIFGEIPISPKGSVDRAFPSLSHHALLLIPFSFSLLQRTTLAVCTSLYRLRLTTASCRPHELPQCLRQYCEESLFFLMRLLQKLRTICCSHPALNYQNPLLCLTRNKKQS